MIEYILAFLLGAVFCLFIQYVLIRRWFLSVPKEEVVSREVPTQCELPEELQNTIRNELWKDKPESCVSLNLIIQFLFQELRDTQRVRRWVIRRMTSEFMELLNSTTGKLLDQITVRDFNLGKAFPVIKSAKVEKIKLHENQKNLEEVCILLDLSYHGDFRLSIDVDMVFGKSAYLSVQVDKLQGTARLMFTRQPYTHWAFVFIEEPLLEFSAQSHFEGRPVPQLTSLILNQLKKTIRKKHTLPRYKIRYRPFFLKPEPPLPTVDVLCGGRRLSQGNLQVHIVKCSRLFKVTSEDSTYCSLEINRLAWPELMEVRRKQWTPEDLVLIRTPALGQLGLTCKDEFVVDRCEDLVIADNVIFPSPAYDAGLRIGDVVAAINGTRIVSSKQAMRLLRPANVERVSIHIERPSKKPGTTSTTATTTSSHEFKYRESLVSVESRQTVSSRQDTDDDFIMIGLAQSKPVITSKDDLDIDKLGKTDSERRPSFSDASSSDSTIRASIRASNSDTNLTAKETTDDEEEILNIRKSKRVASSQEPEFNEKFDLVIGSQHRYLNVCVWCHVCEKVEKQSNIIKVEKDVLLGHVSIPLMTVALSCLTTLQGTYQQTYPLTPAEPRAIASRGKFAHLSNLPGFDEALCSGDVTLGFQHTPQSVSKDERRRVQEQEEEAQEETRRVVAETLAAKQSRRVLLEGQHDFVAMKFTNTTLCEVCRKKIWFKNGLQCHVCHLNSHKKCSERCQEQTVCSKDGWSYRNPYAMMAEGTKFEPDVVKSSDPPSPSKTATFFKKFKRDRTGITESLRRKLEGEVTECAAGPAPAPNLSDSSTAIPIEELLKEAASRAQGTDSDSELEDANFLGYFKTQAQTGRCEELVVNAAKEMGKELFQNLPLEERKVKLQTMVEKLQNEIDAESTKRDELLTMEKKAADSKTKQIISRKIEKSNDKVQSLALLMLHYCSGLQHCAHLPSPDKPIPHLVSPVIPQGATTTGHLEKCNSIDSAGEGSDELFEDEDNKLLLDETGPHHADEQIDKPLEQQLIERELLGSEPMEHTLLNFLQSMDSVDSVEDEPVCVEMIQVRTGGGNQNSNNNRTHGDDTETVQGDLVAGDLVAGDMTSSDPYQSDDSADDEDDDAVNFEVDRPDADARSDRFRVKSTVHDSA